MISLSILNYLRYWNDLPASGNLVLLSIPHDWELWLYSSTGSRNSQFVNIKESNGGVEDYYVLLLVNTLDVEHRNRYWPDLLPFRLRQNVRCRTRPAGFEQLSTGQLHLMVQILASASKRKSTPIGVLFLFAFKLIQANNLCFGRRICGC